MKEIEGVKGLFIRRGVHGAATWDAVSSTLIVWRFPTERSKPDFETNEMEWICSSSSKKGPVLHGTYSKSPVNKNITFFS